MNEKIFFNFNMRGEKGFSEIIYGKGGFFTASGLFAFLIGAVGVVAMPWRKNMPEIAFRTFMFLMLVLFAVQYYIAIIRVSVDDENIFVKIWKREKVYPIKDVKKIKTTYYVSWGLASIRLKCKGKSGFFLLWAPRFHPERYNLYLDMSDYLKRNIPAKSDC